MLEKQHVDDNYTFPVTFSVPFQLMNIRGGIFVSTGNTQWGIDWHRVTETGVLST